MVTGTTLEFHQLSKTFGPVRAVSDLTFTVQPGRVTGFLGPNGAGKTTALRILLGLIKPTSGTATIGGQRYGALGNPAGTVGALLDASGFHPGRTAKASLGIWAKAAQIPEQRIDEVLGLVGLSASAGRKVGGFSLGMKQRLGLAGALLADPGVLVLDEPINGLDPEGIHWLRTFLRHLAAEGRTVLLSSHLLSEVQQTVDDVVVVRTGQLVFHGSLQSLEARSGTAVVVDSPHLDTLATALTAGGLRFTRGQTGLVVDSDSAEHIGALAFTAGVPLRHLAVRDTGLERVFLQLVSEQQAPGYGADAVGYPAHGTGGGAA